MGIYDLSLKTLFDDCPEDFIRLALGGEVELEQVQFHPTETRIVERRQDHLARVRVDGQDFLFLPEFKAAYETDVDRQMFTYFSRATILHEFLPVWPVVYYLSEESYPKHPKTRFESRLWNHSICQLQFFEVRLFEGNAREVLQRKQGALLALVPVMREAGPEQLVEASQAIEALERPPEVRRDLQAVLTILSERIFPGFRLSELIPKELYMGSGFIHEAIEQGLLRGRAEGLAEGLAEGRLQGLLPLLRLKLRRPPTKRQRQTIGEASERALQRFVRELADATDRGETLEALRRLEAENAAHIRR